MSGLNPHRCGRTGFTLIELLVVMIILVILATLAVALVPTINQQQKATNGAGQLSGWMLIAKQRAKRDHHPVGVRLQPPLVAQSNVPVAVPGTMAVPYTPLDPVTGLPANPPTLQVLRDGTVWMMMASGSFLLVDQGQNAEVVAVQNVAGTTFQAQFTKAHQAGFGIRHLGYVQTVQYIEQPEDFSVTGAQPAAAGETPVRRISLSAGPPATATLENVAGNPPDFSGGLGAANQSQWPVQPGDYLELLDGQVHYIAAVPDALHLLLGSTNVNAVNTTDQYRIVRGPRVLRGEPDLQLPVGVVMDLGTNWSFGAPMPFDSMTGNIDVLFSPSGAVVGRATQGNGTIVLWVRDTNQDQVSQWSTNIYLTEPALVAVYPRTGFIATHPVNPPGNPGGPYLFTQDGRSSGM